MTKWSDNRAGMCRNRGNYRNGQNGVGARVAYAFAARG